MTQAEQTDQLREAARLIEEVLVEMDARTTACTCCGQTKLVNYTEGKVAERIEGMPSKLREQAARLDNERIRTGADRAMGGK